MVKHNTTLTSAEIEEAQMDGHISSINAGKLFGYDEDGDLNCECGTKFQVISADGNLHFAEVYDVDQFGVHYSWE